MPHQRKRALLPLIQKSAKFWPVVGLMGMRQSGKSTLLRDQLGLENYYTFDHDDLRERAETSARSFLAQIEKPAVIDEAQKVPKIFDQVKAEVDLHRVPGSFYLSGSSQFLSLNRIQESLTGRMGACYLFPMTLSELDERKFDSERLKVIHKTKEGASIERISSQLIRGGLPVPAFLRDPARIKTYYQSWYDTTIGRDLARVYGRGYNPETADSILNQMGQILTAGLLPDSRKFKQDSRKLNRYLKSMVDVFILQKFTVHEAGTGGDYFLPADSGFCSFLTEYKLSPETTLSLVRVFLLNEILAHHHYQGQDLKRIYYKSTTSRPVDLIWNGTPVQFTLSARPSGWDLRAVEGAMKRIGSNLGVIAAPISIAEIPKNRKGIAIVPWGYWS